MSLRWKLFRFLSVDTILDASAGLETSDAFSESTLFPSLSLSHDQQQQSKQRILRRFNTASERAIAFDSVDGIYILALPRGVVQLFHLAVLDPTLCLSANPAPPTTLHTTFSAHDTGVISVVLVRHALRALPLLVTLGVDDTVPNVKVWTFKQRPGSEQTILHAPIMRELSPKVDDVRFECSAVYRLQADSHPTVLDVKDAKTGTFEISQMAVGFEDGSVIILLGDIARERVSKVRVAPAPGEMLHVKPIVFVKYCGRLLYCVSEMSVVVIVETRQGEKGLNFRRTVLDNLGTVSRSLCCTIDNSEELVVARDEALYFFNRDGRGPCLAFPSKGQKSFISSAGNYLIHSTGPGSVTAYDVVNKLIAYRGKGTVSCAFHSHVPDTRNMLLCFSEGSIIKLSEISLEERVNLLLKRGLYVPAVALARAESGGRNDKQKSILIRALRQYAEYLMSKDRYDDAAEQLVETIDGDDVEPSWVITRLVEQSGLRSGLRLYLEKLHNAGKAAFVHTKVLITCYRHDRARGAILGSEAIEKTTDEHVISVLSDVDWTEEQVDAAIKLCRDARLYKVAERVSRRRGRHVQLARTLVEDLDEAEKALALLRSLQDTEALSVIQACGRQMLTKDPANFVDYLSNAICTSATHVPAGESEAILRLSMFLPLFIDMPRWRAVLLERILSTPGGITSADAPRAWILLFESLVCVDTADRLHLDTKHTLIPTKPFEEGNDLESLAETDNMKSLTSEQSVLFDKCVAGRCALKVLQSRRSILDLRAALEIAEQYGHEPCLEYLYEHLRLYKELGACLRMSGNGTSLLRACRRHGDREPRLWMECIRFYAPTAVREEEGILPSERPSPCMELDTESVGNDGTMKRMLSSASEESERESAQDIVDEAMVALERLGVLSPMEIIDIVISACPDAGWGVVREFFERGCTELRKEAIRSEQAGRLLQTEMNELKKETKRLDEEAEVVNQRTCTSCEDPISVPFVYFFCKHAYHAGCLASGMMGSGGGGNGRDGDGSGYRGGSGVGGGEEGKNGMWGEECPKCAPELDAMVSMRQALQDKNERHDEFFGMLDKTRDGFATILEFLERSPFI